MLGGIFVAPTGYDVTDEMIEQFGETLPDNILHYPDYVPSGEGDTSSESITSFSATLDDDVLFYPDRDGFLYDYAVNGGGANYIAWLSGTIADTQTLNDGDYLRFYEASASPIDDFIILNISYMSQETLCINASSRVGTTSYDTYWYLYNYTSASYVLVYTQPTSDSAFYWYNWTISNDYTDGMSIKVKIQHYDIEFGETWDVQIEYISSHYPATQGYAESFADVSDWSFNSESAGLPARSFTTDDDVLNFSISYDDVGNEWAKYDIDVSAYSGFQYLEIRYKTSVSVGDSKSTALSVYVDGVTIFRSYSADWGTWKGYIADDISEPYTTIMFMVDDYANTHASGYGYVLIEYILIGQSTGMGWQHDCSTTMGFGYQSGKPAIAFSTDGDLVTCNPSGDDARVEIQIDTTTTQAKISEDYYQLIEFSISSVTDGDADGAVWKARAFESSTVYSAFLITEWSDDTGVFRFNLDSLTIDGGGDLDEVEYFKFYLDDADDVLVLDYIQLVSIANFSSYSQHANIDTNDYFYVENGVLYCEHDESNNVYMRMNYDPPLDVNYATYNIVNSTVLKDGSSEDLVGYNWIDAGGILQDTWRTELTQDLTGAPYLKIDNGGSWEIHDLKFWEDSVPPTINNVWATPYSPTEIDDVTLSVYTADWTDLYKVTLNAIDYPATFNDIDYECSKNSEDTDLWTYTFDSANIPAGYYAFQATANDGANTDIELVIFRVVTMYLQVTDIVLITATETIAQLSGYINKVANYVIYENNSDSGSGAVNDGWFSISWAKDTTAGAYIELGIKFTSGAYTEWVNGSYSVATATILHITDTVYSTTGTQNYLSGYANLEVTTWTAYNNNTQIDTGALSAGSFSINWAKNTTEGLYEWGVSFTDGTTTRWVNGSFEVSASLTLLITDTVYSTSDDYLYLSGYTNLGCDWYAYNNDTQMNTGSITAGSFEVNWAKNTTTGLYEWGVKFADGTTTRWINGSFEIAADALLFIQDTVYSATEDRNYLSGHATLGVTTWTAYNNNTQMATGSLTAGSFQVDWAKNTTVGIYEWGVSFTDGTTTRWVNGTFAVDVVEIVITIYTFFGASSDFTYMQFSGHINYDCTYNISEWSDSYALNETHTGSVSEGMFNIAWDKVGVNDVDANFTIVFVNGSLSLTINGYYGTAYKLLRIVEIVVDNTEESQALTNITVNFYTNKDVDWFVYDRDDGDAVLVSGSSVEGSDYLTWAKNRIEHAHYYAVKWTDGVTNIWYNSSYWTFKENIDSLDDPEIDWDARDKRRTIEFWSTVGAIATIIGIAAIGYTHFFPRVKTLELPHYDTQDDEEE